MSWRAERYHTYTASPNPSQDGRLQLGDLEAAAVALQPPNPSPSPDPNPNPNPNQELKAKGLTAAPPLEDNLVTGAVNPNAPPRGLPYEGAGLAEEVCRALDLAPTLTLTLTLTRTLTPQGKVSSQASPHRTTATHPSPNH